MFPPTRLRKVHSLLSFVLQQKEGNPASQTLTPSFPHKTVQPRLMCSEARQSWVWFLVPPLILVLDKCLNLSGLQVSDKSAQINGVKPTHSSKLVLSWEQLQNAILLIIDQKELIPGVISGSQATSHGPSVQDLPKLSKALG